MTTVERIKQTAKSQGRSIAYLCRELGFNSRTYFNDVEKHHRDIPLENLERIASILNVTVDYLLGKEDNLSAPYGTNGFSDELLQKIAQLDELDRIKTDAFVSGLLAAEKYQEPTQTLKIAARGGGVKEITVTDSQLKAIMNLPEVKDLDDQVSDNS